MKNRLIAVLVLLALVSSFVLTPPVKSTDEPGWLPTGWKSLPSSSGDSANYMRRTVILSGDAFFAYPLEESADQPEYLGHGWILFDPAGNVVTDSARYKKLAMTAEWARTYDLLSSAEARTHSFEDYRDGLNAVVKGIRMYEGGKLVVSTGSALLGLIAKIYAKFRSAPTPAVAQDLSTIPGIIKLVIMGKFDMASGTQQCANWMGKSILTSPSQVLATMKTGLTYAAYSQIFSARSSANSVLDAFGQRVTSWSYDQAAAFQEDIYSAELGVPALDFVGDLLSSENWKSTLAIVGNSFLKGFIGISAEELLNEWNLVGYFLGREAPDSPLKKAYLGYVDAQEETIKTLNWSTNAWDVDDDETLAHGLYADIVSQASSANSTKTPWSMYRFDAQHTGRSPYAAASRNGTLKWSFRTGGTYQAVSSPAVAADGTIYMGSNDYNLYAVHPDGSLKWRYRTGGRVWSSPAIAADGTIYVGSEDRSFYALNPDGSLKWQFQTGGVVNAPTITADGTIYVGAEDSYFYAISPSGALKWRYQAGGAIASSPAIASDGTIYVGARDSYLYALRSDGSLKWKYNVGTGTDHSPAIASDGTVYTASGDGALFALYPDGTIKWRFQTGDKIYGPAAIASDGTIYIGSLDYYLYALDPSGELKWKYRTADKIPASPSIDAAGNIYVGSEDGYLHAVRADGTLRWKCQVGNEIWTAPTIAQSGTVYVGSISGTLHAIGD